MILAADVGGTRTRIGLFKRAAGKLRSTRVAEYPTRDTPSFESIIDRFLSEGRERVHRCGIGVAGPVVDGRSQRVNLHWVVDARRVALHLKLPRVELCNDVEAAAYGVSQLAPKKRTLLTPGLRAKAGNAAMIAVGTGLGMAVMVWDGKRHVPMATEGGHQGLSPSDDLQIALLRHLRRKHGRVSLERVLSGAAFSDVYGFFRENGWGEPTSEMKRRFAEAQDVNAAICDAGLQGEDRLAVRVVEMFVSMLGGAAGDLALMVGAVGGVYLAGGILPRLVAELKSPRFLDSFRDKGRLRSYVEKIPVRLISEPRVALFGAAIHASEAVPAGRTVRKTKRRVSKRKR